MSPFASEKYMAQGDTQYTAVPQGTEPLPMGSPHSNNGSNPSHFDEDVLFEGNPDPMDFSDNETLYYGISLGSRKHLKRKRGFWATVISLVVIAVFGGVWLYFDGLRYIRKSKKHNIILMISDGFGPASETMARNYVQQTRNLPVHYQSPLDKILVGSSRTRSSSSLITDSAAGATAFSCGLKSFNGAIGVTDDKMACGTVLEAAKLQRNMATGLVVTSRVTHATPASFSAHAIDRNMEDLIGEYQIGNYSLGPSVDLMFGGGKCHFLPQEHPDSCRLDSRDLWGEAKDKGFNLIDSRKAFDALKTKSSHKLPLFGAFASSHMDYEIDRDDKIQPSLAEMTERALQILNGNDNGFFLMVEGSRIDMAAHTNDPAAHLHDIIAYWDAVEVVRKFVDENPDTVMISVSDHETGGFSVAKQLTDEYPEYLWDPFALEPVKHSIEYISDKLIEMASSMEEKYAFVRDTVFPEWLGIKDATNQMIADLAQETDSVKLRQAISDVESRRAQLGWSTHGHSAVDVNLYAYGKDAHLLDGNHENTDIGHFVVGALGLDLEVLTLKLSGDKVVQNEAPVKEAWLGRRDLDAAEHYPHIH